MELSAYELFGICVDDTVLLAEACIVDVEVVDRTGIGTLHPSSGVSDVKLLLAGILIASLSKEAGK